MNFPEKVETEPRVVYEFVHSPSQVSLLVKTLVRAGRDKPVTAGFKNDS